MAVKSNPYRYWEDKRDTSDYRSKETQASSLARQMMSQPEYLRDSNRVNPGPRRNTRADSADAKQQTPHNTTNEDVWGWQPWIEVGIQNSDVSNNLKEESTSGFDEYLNIDGQIES